MESLTKHFHGPQREHLSSIVTKLLQGGGSLDLRRWERVAVSANNLWFQRGLGQKVHQVALENIRDVIPFPKTNQGTDLMTGAPVSVDPSQLFCP
mgnify:CR=1 FL=1